MKTLLWVDDDEKLLTESSPLFERNGFKILKATTPSAALRALRVNGQELDGVLLDVRLGGGENGLELLDELRKIHGSLQVVIFTAYPDYAGHVEARIAGALAYFQKVEKSLPLAPAKQAEFFAALHRLFPDRVQNKAAGRREKTSNAGQRQDDAAQRRRKSERSDGSFLKWAWFIFGCIFVCFSLSIVAWAFYLRTLTEDQRFLLMWLLPVASGFACGCFAGSMTAKGPVGPIVVAATGGFAVWLLTHFLLRPPPAQNGFVPSANSEHRLVDLMEKGLPKTDHPVVDLSRPVETQVQLFPEDKVRIVGLSEKLNRVWFGDSWRQFDYDRDDQRQFTVMGPAGKPMTPRFEGTGMVKLEVSFTLNREKRRDLRSTENSHDELEKK